MGTGDRLGRLQGEAAMCGALEARWALCEQRGCKEDVAVEHCGSKSAEVKTCMPCLH